MIKSILLLAVALSLDAFGVALGIGCGKELESQEKFSLVFSFGFFQALLALIGGVLGSFISNYFFDISGYLGGIIILIIGTLFIKEGLENKEACVYYRLDFWKYILLGISVSIDALGIGFSVLHQYSIYMVINNSLIIGFVAAVSTLIAIVTVKYIKNLMLVEKYAEYLGGIILILFGIKMFLG